VRRRIYNYNNNINVSHLEGSFINIIIIIITTNLTDLNLQNESKSLSHYGVEDRDSVSKRSRNIFFIIMSSQFLVSTQLHVPSVGYKVTGA